MQCSAAWTACDVQDLRLALGECQQLTLSGKNDIWKAYWSAHQRFFKLLCISLKVRLPGPSAAHLQNVFFA